MVVSGDRHVPGWGVSWWNEIRQGGAQGDQSKFQHGTDILGMYLLMFYRDDMGMPSLHLFKDDTVVNQTQNSVRRPN